MKYIGLITLLLISMNSFAARKYVSDVLYIPVRTGPSNKHKIIGYLKSGTQVTALKSADEYTEIKSHGEKQRQGWVKARFLLDEPIAAMKLEQLNDDMKRMTEIRQELNQFKSQAESLKSERDGLVNQLERIKKVSSSAVEIDQENQSLKAKVVQLEKELTDVKEKNFLLEEDQRNEGIKLGIFAIALGTLVGFVLPYMKPRGQKRRNSGIRLR
ncbi:TIGR04211 family SH3 domain-containing protein [Pseudobacteriovorax antillogorgiicola]|uniref:SH3 domain protein n=1 Tax=Pseudobacteriovorax antillogorgiicola TaxID=1513793 RepID=A0A1Y6CKV7_9BACT|nr:TIGR04211 family SH3 domain-containing protein [Pseudobacteriovorax antillogorgiicola]TCS45400.1 SH3 domain protein [Pseudobacteriovorax antillogorgiicola]SMF73882.1 SH3 domain protein [Pseudobacteriovorax antillogorgiicola]